MTATLWERARLTLGALRLPWPGVHGSVWRLLLLFLGASLAAMPREASVRFAVFRVVAMEACGACAFFGTVLLNDIVDRDLDKVAHPDRPLARGSVRVGDARALCVLLYAITLAGAAVFGWMLFAAVVAWLLAPVLTHYLVVKGRRGARHAYSDLLTPLQFAALAVFVYLGFGNHDALAIALLAALIYCSDASLNVLQGIRDLAADDAFGVSTIAVRHGRSRARYAALMLHAAVLPCAFAYGWRTSLGPIWLGALAVIWAGAAVAIFGAHRDEGAVRRGEGAAALTLHAAFVGIGIARGVDFALRAR